TEQELIKHQQEIDDKASQDALDKVESDLTDFETITATKEELGEVLSALNDYKEILDKADEDVASAKQEISDLLTRVPAIENHLGEFIEQWFFLDTYIRMGDEGLLIQEKTGSTG